MTLFFLEAFERVYKHKAKEYEGMGRTIDKKVEDTEPGMLIHTHMKVSENDHEVVYRWLEVFQSYEDFVLHLHNEAVLAHVEKINNGFLVAPVEVVIYCNWTEEQKACWQEQHGMHFTFAPIINGYFRHL